MLHLPLALVRSATALALAVAVLTTSASSAPRDGDPKNAATWYARSIAAWQKFRQTSPQQADLLANFAGDPTQPITSEVRAALAAAQGAIGDFRKGSQQEYCDFSLDYSQGFELLLPHLSEMRGLARAMRADAAVRLADGDASGAAAELASMYKSSGHMGDDRVLISSLIGQAIFQLSDAGVQSGLDSAAFNAADAASLLGGAKQLGTNDPFAYLEAMGMEQEIVIATFEKYRGPDGLKKLGELMGDPQATERLAGLDDAAFDAELVKYDDMMTRINSAFALTDKDAATAAMKAISDDIESGKLGVLASVVAPAFGKILERKFAGEQMIADRIATLEKLVSGEQRPEEVANAAIWYLRAIEMWDALPKEQRQAILGFDAGDLAQAPPAEVAAALVEAQPIFDVVREASIKRRCDFAPLVRRRGPPPVAPHYAPGMAELLLALRNDARRLLAAGDRAAVIDRLAIALRAAGHLGNDVNLAVCRTGHVHFNRVIDVLEAAQSAGTLDVHAMAATPLADAAGRVSRKDPFGYLHALQDSRDWIVSYFNYNVTRNTQEDLNRWAEQTGVIKLFNADQTMFALVLLDERMRRMIASPPPQAEGAPAWEPDDITLPETIERLRGVFDAAAVDAVRAQFDEIGPRIAQDDWSFFVGRVAAPVAGLTEGLSRVRGDLRRATRLLMLPEDAPADASKPAGN